MQRASCHRPTSPAPGVSAARLFGAVLACGLALAGCGPAPAPPPPAPAPGSEVAAPEEAWPEEFEDASHTGTDREFARLLVEHHHQQLELAGIAEYAGDPATASFAEAIGRERRAQLDELSAWLISTEGAPSGSAPEDLGLGEAPLFGTPNPELAARLRQTSGPEFTPLFKQAMSGLYDSSGQLAQAELEEGSAAQMRALAERILDEHDAELSRLHAL
ncbi:DUF305 domain-containing protein [Saccharopolyspora sp. MS10]|uniref:DUF305 domain-containing protein n=1 Tax=Saccharopolyspora sp. MS10 TaxID=3385973 RepID=UPI0039A072DE